MLHTILHSMFHLELPVLEKILRPMIVFLFLVGVLRLFGKRELAQLNPFDLVVLLSLSNTVQNAIIGDDNSVTGGLIGAFALLAVNWAVARLLYKWPGISKALGGHETVLVRDGRMDRKAMDEESLTAEDLLQAIHKQGFAGFDDVSRVQLDPDGAFFVVGKSPSASDTKESQILAKLDELHKEVVALRAQRT